MKETEGLKIAYHSLERAIVAMAISLVIVIFPTALKFIVDHHQFYSLLSRNLSFKIVMIHVMSILFSPPVNSSFLEFIL